MNNKYLICLSIIILIILYIILILEKKKEHFTEQEYLDKIEKIIKEEEIPNIDYVICDNLNVNNNANIDTLTSNTNNFKITSLNGDTLNSKTGEIVNNNSKSISNVNTKDININNNQQDNTKIIIKDLNLNNKDINLNSYGDQIKYINVNNASIEDYFMPNDNSLFIKLDKDDNDKNNIKYKDNIYKKLRCKNIKGRDYKNYSIMTY